MRVLAGHDVRTWRSGKRGAGFEMPHHLPSQRVSLPRAVQRAPLKQPLFLRNPAGQLSDMALGFENATDRKTYTVLGFGRRQAAIDRHQQ